MNRWPLVSIHISGCLLRQAQCIWMQVRRGTWKLLLALMSTQLEHRLYGLTNAKGKKTWKSHYWLEVQNVKLTFIKLQIPWSPWALRRQRVQTYPWGLCVPTGVILRIKWLGLLVFLHDLTQSNPPPLPLSFSLVCVAKVKKNQKKNLCLVSDSERSL